MTISSSLNAGIAGLSANANRLASISDNIANASTYGYKRVQTDFHSMVSASNGGTYSAGGLRTSTNRLIDEGGSLISTSNATDLAVRGRGMLPVTPASQVSSGQDARQMLLATTGSFRPDASGYMTSQSGMVLMGWPTQPDGSVPNFPRDTFESLTPVQINANQFLGEPTTSLSLGLNLPATETEAGSSGDTRELSVEYYDNLGSSESLRFEFTPTVPGTGSSNEWTMTVHDGATGGTIVGEYVLTFNNTRADGGTLDSVTTTSGGTYNPATGSLIVNVDSGPIEINIGELNTNGGFTQLGDQFAPASISKDGSPVGNMTSVEVDENGMVRAFFDTGITQTLFQIPLVDLPNPNGLIALDNQTYRPSPDSGSFYLWDAGSGPTGEITPYSREESTTDVASELTSMIQTQRAYSSNAKVIQTVDEMLQETTNIKR